MDHAVCCEELITADGRRRFDRGCWTLELLDAVASMRERHYAFYVMVDGERVDLTLAARRDGTPYLRPVDPAAAAGLAPALPALPELLGDYARPVSLR